MSRQMLNRPLKIPAPPEELLAEHVARLLDQVTRLEQALDERLTRMQHDLDRTKDDVNHLRAALVLHEVVPSGQRHPQ